MNKLLLTLTVFILILSAGCSRGQKTWITDLEAAELLAEKNEKDVMLVFTGSDWNDESKHLAESVFTGEFFAKASKKFILCNIDVLRDESLVEQDIREKNYQAASRFAVQQIPSIFLITTEKDVYGVFATESANSDLASFFDRVDSFSDKRELLVGLKDKIQNSTGPEKAGYMDQFLESLYPLQRDTYRQYVEEITRIDEDGTAGLGPKYLLQLQYLRAMDLYQEDNLEAAGEGFFALAKSGKLDPAKKQEALYMGAYMYAMSETVPETRLIEWLEEAIAADPENPGVLQIQTMIDRLSQPEASR